MKTEWDYTELADAYLQRPDYADSAIEEMLEICGTKPNDKVCDVGAGVAHLTLMLASRGLIVTAGEPNDAMRSNGIKRTAGFKDVSWYEGTGEHTGQADKGFRLVTFGSSFNVCDRAAALIESSRILEPNGWFACMWNHRSLADPIQSKIESCIKNIVPDYQYGTRREDQTEAINESGLFNPVTKLMGEVIHEQSIEDCVSAWKSHGTLDRQAGTAFPDVIRSIESYLKGLNVASIQVPYTTNVWVAQLK